jgi:DNA-binding protein H-NS
MGIDLSNMSMDELTALEKDIVKAKAALEKKRIGEARKAMEMAAREYGMTVEDVLAQKPERKSAQKGVAKYANPDNPEQTWTGRGRQPTWYKEAVKAGTDPASMEI